MNKLLFTILILLAGNALKGQNSCQPLLHCPAVSDTICDITDNDPLYWNQLYFYDSLNGTHNLAEASTDLSFSYRDSCGTGVASFLLLLDLDGDDSLETALTPAQILTGGRMIWKNASNPGYAGTDTLVFDSRAVQTTAKWQFTLDTLIAGDTTTLRLRWAPGNHLHNYALPQLPYGRHKIIWSVAEPDSIYTCSRSFTIRDCKKPVVKCLHGFSVNIMPTSTVQLWASDFLFYTQDNVTPSNIIRIGIRKVGTGVDFPVDNMGNALTHVVYSCAELGPQTLELWAKDKAENVDSCQTTVIVKDGMGNCEAPISFFLCTQSFCDEQGVEGVGFQIAGTNPALPSVNFFAPDFTDQYGCCITNAQMPIASDYTVTPVKNDNPLNGVTTYDLVLISKHILGLQRLNNPYKMIAADVNKSNSITTFDIVELRKLIIGIYDSLPNNTSWRFLDPDFIFPDSTNAFATSFPEFISGNIQGNPYLKFWAIKTGDVNCSVTTAFGNEMPKDRGTQYLRVPDAYLEPGVWTEVPVYPAEDGQWDGFQLSVQTNPAEVELGEALPGNLPGMDADVFGRPQSGVLNASWFSARPAAVRSNEPLFSLRLRAQHGMLVSDALQLGGGRLRPEAYPENEAVSNLAWLFETPGNDGNFAARPNPTSGAFAIPVGCTNAEVLSVVLYDMQGQAIYRSTFSANKGMNLVQVPAEALSAPGVYNWQITGAGQQHQGKIIRQ